MSEIMIRGPDGLERSMRLVTAEVTIGRSPTCDIVVPDKTTSSNHALLVRQGKRWLVRDLGSTNGTKVNSVRVRERFLNPGDEIQIGHTTILYLGEPEPDRAPAPALPAPPPASPLGVGDTLRLSMAALATQLLEPATDPVEGSTSRAMQRLTLVYRLATELNRLEDPAEIANRLARFVESSIGARRVAVYLIGKEGKPEPRATVGGAPDDGDLVAEVLGEGHAVLLAGPPSRAGVPLMSRNEAMGVIAAFRSDGSFDDEDLRVLGIVANLGSGILYNASLYNEMRLANEEMLYAKQEILRMNQDLEEKVRARTAELVARTQEVERLSREKDLLLGMAAHDLRTPMTVILGLAQLLQSPKVTAEEVQEGLKTVEQVCLDLHGLLQDLLDVTVIEMGRIEIRPKRVSPRVLLKECIDLHALPARAKEIDLDLALTDDVPDVLADPGRTSQILSNLVGNAIKYCPKGSHVTLSAEPSGDRLIVSVKDDGPGMEPELVRRLFTPGERGPHQTPGHGLGLHIARRLAELQGGGISVESNPGQGSLFSFDLPRAPVK